MLSSIIVTLFATTTSYAAKSSLDILVMGDWYEFIYLYIFSIRQFELKYNPKGEDLQINHIQQQMK